MLACLQPSADGVLIRLYVQPRSSRNQIVGLHGDSLKVKITAPPVEGSANSCCCDFLARLFGLPKGRVELVSGERSRLKRVLLRDVELDSAAAVLSAILS